MGIPPFLSDSPKEVFLGACSSARMGHLRGIPFPAQHRCMGGLGYDVINMQMTHKVFPHVAHMVHVPLVFPMSG